MPYNFIQQLNYANDRFNRGYFETVLKTVSDVNQELTFTFYATASDGATVDTSIKIYAYVIDLSHSIE